MKKLSYILVAIALGSLASLSQAQSVPEMAGFCAGNAQKLKTTSPSPTVAIQSLNMERRLEEQFGTSWDYIRAKSHAFNQQKTIQDSYNMARDCSSKGY